ncbi:transposase-like protein [Pectobacterium versatile]|nr:transposase-like protein [Pectobacterium versatile]
MEKSANWRTQSRPVYSHDLKLRIVELASQPDANIAQIARENGVAYNLIFRWLRLWQKEGRVSRRLPATITPSSSPALLPVEVIPEPALPCMPLLRCHIAYTTVTVLSLYHRINFSTQTRASSRVLNPDDGHCGTYSASGTVTQRTHYHCSPAACYATTLSSALPALPAASATSSPRHCPRAAPVDDRVSGIAFVDIVQSVC